MSVRRHIVVLVVGVLAGGILATGTVVAVEAGASSSNVAYSGCVSAKGALSKVGSVTPTCPSGSSSITWNSRAVR